MSNPYGPWATAINAGRNPQLSAFWRQRLTMLVPTSQTSAVLSRRSLACLFAAAALLIVLPSFRVAEAVADEEKKMSNENSSLGKTENTANESPVAKSSGVKPSQNISIIGAKEDQAPPANGPMAGKPMAGNSSLLKKSGGGIFISTVTTDAMSSSYLILPISVSCALSSEKSRKDLHLSSDQEKELGEISRKYLKQRQVSGQTIRKEIEKLSPEERVRKEREFRTKSAEEAKNVRLQVEKLLTAEQWTAVKGIAMGLSGLGRLMSDPQFREKVGVTEQQAEELSKRLIEAGKIQEKRLSSVEAWKENEKKSLAVITPQQWEQVEQIVGNSDAGMALLSAGIATMNYPSPEWQELHDPAVRKQLALSAEQQTKLDDFSARSQAQSLELSKLVHDVNRPLPAKDREAKSAEFQSKVQEMRKQDRASIEGLLTAQQLATLKKLTIRREVLNNLYVSGQFKSGTDDQKPSGIFERIKVTQEQMKELRGLSEEKDRMLRQHWREAGETALKMLSPQQQDKFLDALESDGL